MYPHTHIYTQKKPLIKRGNISEKGDPKEKISQVTILLIKK
jgi:hypothetical protein